MEQSFKTDIKDKEDKYLHFIPDWELLISGETDETAVLANTCAALREAFGFFGTPIRISVRTRTEKAKKK